MICNVFRVRYLIPLLALAAGLFSVSMTGAYAQGAASTASPDASSIATTVTATCQAAPGGPPQAITSDTATVTVIPIPTQAVYRLFCPYFDCHFYTTDPALNAYLAGCGAWNAEGVIGYAPISGVDGTAPVYQLFGPWNVEFFYTVNPAERDIVVNVLGYQSCGTAFSVFTTPGANRLPLYRLLTPDSPFGYRHFYTTNQAEHDSLVADGYWFDEGILGYLNPAPSGG